MSDQPKKKRAGSVMGDDERAQQPRPAAWQPTAREASGEIETAAPDHEYTDFESITPPPIVVDDVGRPIARSVPTTLAGRPRAKKTMQQIAEELWPARKALDMLLEHSQKIAAIEARAEALESNGPAAVAAAQVAALRAELVGHDGDGGTIGALAETVRRDLADNQRAMLAVEERATKSDKFVRRFLYTVGGLVAGSIVGAIMLIYAAGQASVRGEARLNDMRIELMHRAETHDRSLTELQGQVKLLLETQLGRPRP